MSEETLEGWNERVREITREDGEDGVQRMCGTWIKPAAFGEVHLMQACEKGRLCRGGKQAKQRHTWAFFVNGAENMQNRVVSII